jgi:hypothetical protein
MRQGQQHRRGRGRNNNNNNNNNSNNNNRRGHNPLSRSFESNGPEVKVRGTPAHIAEKYLSLARDAQSSGDPVLAENYLQHAEHYNRIIMAYREQQAQHSGEMVNGNGPRMRPGGPSEGGEADDVLDEEGDDLSHGEQPPMPRFQPEQPRFQEQQPRFQDQPRNDEGRQHHRGQDHPRFRDRQERHERHNDRQPDTRQARDRSAEPQPPVEGGGQARNEQFQRRRERFGPGNEQPEFLRRPVRRPRREGNGNGEAEGVAETGHENDPQDKNIV